MFNIPEIKQFMESKKNSNICIVIPTFNQYEITKKTILKLKEQTIQFDIVVVDNASNDNTFENLNNDFLDITILLSKENYGGAGGLFIGQKYAYEKGYEYIILSDNDAIPLDNDLIEEIVKNSDENYIVDFVNSAEEIEPSLRIFHYGCYHRDIIKKIGYVEWKMFIYGDDVEYWLRLEKHGIKRKKIYKKYWHPMKYHYPVNRVYFDIRNELENGKNYSNRRKHTIESIFIKSLFFQLYKPTKYKLLKQAIEDWRNGIWDNNTINNKYEMDINYEIRVLESFFNNLDKKDTVITHIKIVEDYLLRKKLSFEWYQRKYLFPLSKKILISNNYIKSMFFYNEIYYLVSIFENKVTYFKLPKISFYKKIIALKNSIMLYFELKRFLNAS